MRGRPGKPALPPPPLRGPPPPAGEDWVGADPKSSPAGGRGPRRAGGGPRRPLRGYILAEALVSAALASLAGGLSVTLLIWSAQAIDRAQSNVGAMQVMERLYEESRLAAPDDLGRPASGTYGRFQWVRSPGRPLDDATPYAPVPVRFFVRWTSGGRVEAREVQVIVRPAAAAATP